MLLRSQCLASPTSGRHSGRVKSPISRWSSLSVTAAASTLVDIEWVLVMCAGRCLPVTVTVADVSLAQRRYDDFGVVLLTSRSGVDVITRQLNRLHLTKGDGDAAFSSDRNGDCGQRSNRSRWWRRRADVDLVMIEPSTNLSHELSPSTDMMSLSDVTCCSEHRKSTSDCCSFATSSVDWLTVIFVNATTLYIT